MKKVAMYIVIGVILSSAPAIALDGGRGIDVALRSGQVADPDYPKPETIPVADQLCGCQAAVKLNQVQSKGEKTIVPLGDKVLALGYAY